MILDEDLVELLHVGLDAADAHGRVGRRGGRLHAQRDARVPTRQRGTKRPLLSVGVRQFLESLQVDVLQTVRNLPAQEIRALQLLDLMEGVHPRLAVFRAIDHQTRPLVRQRGHAQPPAPCSVDDPLQLVISTLVEEHVSLSLQRQRTLERV